MSLTPKVSLVPTGEAADKTRIGFGCGSARRVEGDEGFSGKPLKACQGQALDDFTGNIASPLERQHLPALLRQVLLLKRVKKVAIKAGFGL